MNTTIKQLPEYFAIKRDVNNSLWKQYITWLNLKYHVYFVGNVYTYYGFDGTAGSAYELKNFRVPVTEITLEQWDNIVNKKDEFILPEKWCVEVNLKNQQFINKVRDRSCGTNTYITSILLNNNKNSWKAEIQAKNLGFREITFEQFKKYVLKQDNMKEIIGYKLIKPEYATAVRRIINCDPKNDHFGIDTLGGEGDIKLLKQAGVLDLWFEPVYKEKKTLPRINGYEGKLEKTVQLKGDLIVYGCAKFSTYWVEELYKAFEKTELFTKYNTRKLKSIKLDSGVEITIEQIKEIYEYIKSKD